MANAKSKRKSSWVWVWVIVAIAFVSVATFFYYKAVSEDKVASEKAQSEDKKTLASIQAELASAKKALDEIKSAQAAAPAVVPVVDPCSCTTKRKARRNTGKKIVTAAVPPVVQQPRAPVATMSVSPPKVVQPTTKKGTKRVIAFDWVDPDYGKSASPAKSAESESQTTLVILAPPAPQHHRCDPNYNYTSGPCWQSYSYTYVGNSSNVQQEVSVPQYPTSGAPVIVSPAPPVPAAAAPAPGGLPGGYTGGSSPGGNTGV